MTTDHNEQQAKMVGEGDIIVAIGNAIGRLGFAKLNQRQIDAVLQAGKIVFDELAKPHRFATTDSGLESWLASDDTNLASRFMAQQLADRGAKFLVTISDDRFPAGTIHNPTRPYDFFLCRGLTMSVPDFKPRIGEMATFSPAWRAIVNNWDELEVLLLEELPTGGTPKLEARMAEVIAAETKQGDEIVTLAGE